MNCLLHIHEIFDDDGDRRFLNELYMEDYLIWIQQVHPRTIANYSKHLHTVGFRLFRVYMFMVVGGMNESRSSVCSAA